VFQWDEEKTREQMLVGRKKQRIFHLSKLRDEFMGTKKLRHEGKPLTRERIFATANAYVLYILGGAIFPDVSSSRVNANFIQLLEPFDKIHEYSWGTAMIAHSLTELRKASRSERNQIGGNMAFLQAWTYVHFPSMATRAFENQNWDGENYGTKYNFKSRPKEQRIDYLDLRVELDNLTAKDVVFDPYKDSWRKGKGKAKEDDYNAQFEYHGPLFHPGGYVMYNPSRVARQCGFRQKIPVPHKMFKLDLVKSEATELHIVIAHKPVALSDYWNNRRCHKYPLTTPSRTDDEAALNYMRWYLNVSHPRVKRVDVRPMIEDKDTALAYLVRIVTQLQ
jgi:Plant mobile domain